MEQAEDFIVWAKSNKTAPKNVYFQMNCAGADEIFIRRSACINKQLIVWGLGFRKFRQIWYCAVVICLKIVTWARAELTDCFVFVGRACSTYYVHTRWHGIQAGLILFYYFCQLQWNKLIVDWLMISTSDPVRKFNVLLWFHE